MSKRRNTKHWLKPAGEEHNRRRGFTKPFSPGKIGSEQHDESSLMKCVTWHLKHGSLRAAGRLAARTLDGRMKGNE